ncbi:hypothetical protein YASMINEVIRUS_1219 [Yasminevirus sp. GU-2018]|uniref:Uncharacterized protein n=1 Tax=Yasminevirus sp. GU-2018 TaxID=2420051 RepID=A0A5K0U9K1_9VIRU|nr:hypothetical protein YASMINEVIRUS_1219 [Yasminevirus sp. GU-2018]
MNDSDNHKHSNRSTKRGDAESNDQLIAYLQLNDRSIADVSKLCKEQMCREVADQVVEILASNVVKHDKLVAECADLKKKLDVAEANATESKKTEMRAICLYRTWRYRAIVMFLAILFIIALFMFAGDDVARLIGQPGCLSWEESYYMYGSACKYYLMYFRYMCGVAYTWVIGYTSTMISYCQSQITY